MMAADNKPMVFKKGRQGSALAVCARGRVFTAKAGLVGWKRLSCRAPGRPNACLLPSCGASLLG